jgi:hypothetical protein
VPVSRVWIDFVTNHSDTSWMLVALAAVALTTGVHGTVAVDPASPVCLAGRSCSAPDAHDVLAFRRGGRTVHASTDGRGRYRVALAPGRYAVSAPRRRGIARLAPREVVVVRGRVRRVDFTLDIGIR